MGRNWSGGSHNPWRRHPPNFQCKMHLGSSYLSNTQVKGSLLRSECPQSCSQRTAWAGDASQTLVQENRLAFSGFGASKIFLPHLESRLIKCGIRDSPCTEASCALEAWCSGCVRRVALGMLGSRSHRVDGVRRCGGHSAAMLKLEVWWMEEILHRPLHSLRVGELRCKISCMHWA